MTFVVLQAKHPSLSLVPSFPETNSRISNRHGYQPKERVNEEMPLHLARRGTNSVCGYWSDRKRRIGRKDGGKERKGEKAVAVWNIRSCVVIALLCLALLRGSLCLLPHPQFYSCKGS